MCIIDNGTIFGEELIKYLKMDQIRAKFQCNSVEAFETTKIAKLSAIYSDKGENKAFTDSTPSGTMEIMISNDAPASEFLQPGKYYYLDFSEAPRD